MKRENSGLWIIALFVLMIFCFSVAYGAYDGVLDGQIKMQNNFNTAFENNSLAMFILSLTHVNSDTVNVTKEFTVADTATFTVSCDATFDSTVTSEGYRITVDRDADDEYYFYYDLSDRDGDVFPNGGAFKTYIFNTEVDREATEDMTGDSRDVMYKGVYRNYGQNDASSQVQGIGISVRNESGGTMAVIKGAEFGVNTKSGATSTAVTGLETTVEHYSAGATTDLFVAKFDVRNEGTEATNQYGVVITNTDNSTANASDASIYITDAGTNTGWDYGLDMGSATIGTAEIRGQNGETIDNTTNGEWDFGAGVLATTGAIQGITLDTGQGANELYDMDQNVLTTSDVTFADVIVDSLYSGTIVSTGTIIAGQVTSTDDIRITDDLSVGGIISNTALQTKTLAAADTTFAITSNIIQLTGDGGTNNLTIITGAGVGIYTILFVDSNITVVDDDTHAANTIDLAGTSTNLSGADDTTLTIMFDGTSFFEVSRSVN